jgi:hypothetical protein
MEGKFNITIAARYRRSRKYKSLWYEIVELYGVNCCYCHQVPATEIDHVIPVSYIEYHGIENLRPSCSWCNLLAGATVFGDFDAKYEWLREARQKKRKGKNRRTYCTDCRLPYQHPLHSPAMFQCAECYDKDNLTAYAKRYEWKEWISLLQEARIDVKVYREFGKEIRGLRKTYLSQIQKNVIFGTIVASFLAEAIGEEESIEHKVEEQWQF